MFDNIVEAVQPGLYWTWSETSNTGVLAVPPVPESQDQPSQMNCVLRIHDFYMYDTKAADQLRCNCTSGQRLDFRYVNCIVRQMGHCIGGNFNIHIWA